MLRSILSLAIMIAYPFAAAAHTSLVPHDHPHGVSVLLGAEAGLLALVGAGVAVFAFRAIANRRRAAQPIRRRR